MKILILNFWQIILQISHKIVKKKHQEYVIEMSYLYEKNE